MLFLVNHVAEDVEKEFPSRLVQTLVYGAPHCRVPKQMRPRPNVLIWLCTPWSCFSHPLATCDHAQVKVYRGQLAEWSRVAPHLWVWDYTTDFPHYLLPLPNQRILGENIRFFVENNVTGVMEEDTPNALNSELAALGGYVMAKCLWSPKYDSEKAINEFLNAYYGKAARLIRTYIDTYHDFVKRENIHVGVWFEADAPHLTETFLVDANRLWQQAEDTVASEPELLKRVRTGRLSVDFAILERGRLQALGKLPKHTGFEPLVIARFHPFST